MQLTLEALLCAALVSFQSLQTVPVFNLWMVVLKKNVFKVHFVQFLYTKLPVTVFQSCTKGMHNIKNRYNYDDNDYQNTILPWLVSDV